MAAVYVVSAMNVPLGVYPTREMAVQSIRLTEPYGVKVKGQGSDSHTVFQGEMGEYVVQAVIPSTEPGPLF